MAQKEPIEPFETKVTKGLDLREFKKVLEEPKEEPIELLSAHEIVSLKVPIGNIKRWLKNVVIPPIVDLKCIDKYGLEISKSLDDLSYLKVIYRVVFNAGDGITTSAHHLRAQFVLTQYFQKNPDILPEGIHLKDDKGEGNPFEFLNVYAILDTTQEEHKTVALGVRLKLHTRC